MEKFIKYFYVEPEKIKDKSSKDKEEIDSTRRRNCNHRGNARNQYYYGVKRSFALEHDHDHRGNSD